MYRSWVSLKIWRTSRRRNCRIINTISSERTVARTYREKHGVPLLGQIPLVQSIRESGDSGLPAVLKEGITADAFKDLAESLARQIAIRNANFTQTKRVELKV